MSPSDILQWFAQDGVLAALLLIRERPRVKSSLRYSEVTPDGIGTYSKVQDVVDILENLGLALAKREGRRAIRVEITPKGEKLVGLIEKGLL